MGEPVKINSCTTICVIYCLNNAFVETGCYNFIVLQLKSGSQGSKNDNLGCIVI